ncbi:MAG TPA: ATP-binding protein [Elusimicrobiales bacterium]|nr:ATP-binding protein [Elusimicrobiales bacterium]
MDFAAKKKSMHAIKFLVLVAGLYGVYALYAGFSRLAADNDIVLDIWAKNVTVSELRLGKEHLARPGAAGRQQRFMAEYYALGRALSAQAELPPATRTSLKAAIDNYYAILPLAEQIFRPGADKGKNAEAQAAFGRLAWRISRLCREGAEKNAKAANRLLVKAGLGFFAVLGLLLLLELADISYICEPFFKDLYAVNRKIWLHSSLPHFTQSPGEILEMRAGLDSMVDELLTARTERARLELEAGARQARMKIQTRSLEFARKKVVTLIEDLEETRAELQKEKRAMTAAGEKLERSNKELEQFAYVASHDLKEPLRIVSSFSGLLSKRYAAQLDADANDFIRYIAEGARRSTELITALFDYAKVTYSSREFTPVPALAALQKAMFNLKIAIEDKKARIIFDDLPYLHVNEFQLIQLFQNLIANSLKFNTAPQPEIRIGYKETAADVTLFFSDNGIGIAPEHYERIFLVFQRLHSHEKYPGAGIGLALCKKIAEIHGGTISVEPAPGGGTTFLVKFPKQRQLCAAAAAGPEPAKKADL